MHYVTCRFRCTNKPTGESPVGFLSMMRQYLCTRTAFNMNAHYAHIEGVRGGGEGGGNDDDDNDDHDLR